MQTQQLHFSQDTVTLLEDIASRTPEPSANPSLGVLVGLTVTCPVQTPEICVRACMARIGATHASTNTNQDPVPDAGRRDTKNPTG